MSGSRPHATRRRRTGLNSPRSQHASPRKDLESREVAALRSEGCTVDDRTETSEFGQFGWVMDPRGIPSSSGSPRRAGFQAEPPDPADIDQTCSPGGSLHE
jgi:hypothetical protein